MLLQTTKEKDLVVHVAARLLGSIILAQKYSAPVMCHVDPITYTLLWRAHGPACARRLPIFVFPATFHGIFGLSGTFLQNHTKVRTRNGAIQNGRELALTFSRADRGEPFSTVAARLGRARLWVEMIAVCCEWNTVGGLVLLLTFRPNY